MALEQVLSNTLEEWQKICGLDFALLTTKGDPIVSLTSRKMPAHKKIEEFLEQEARNIGNASMHLYKVYHQEQLNYLLVVWGKEISDHTIGELAVCQLESLLQAYHQKNDKNTFMQNYLQGSYSSVEMVNQARRLKISLEVPRAIFLVETRQEQDANALATIRNIFSARTGDFVTSLESGRIVIVKELQSTDAYQNLRDTANMLVDMLNTEAMTQAWVSYGDIAAALKELPHAYKEAQTALEVGKIFDPSETTFSYKELGIGHLIYQLPVDICEMFLEQILKGESLDSLDEETLLTVKIFFENNLNLAETSRQLYVHRNTLVYRFEKLEKKFGLDIRTFENALTFKIAMMVADYLKFRK